MADTDILAGLSPRMLDALAFVLRPRPNSIHEHDREPIAWVRMETKPTVQALHRRGLVDEWWRDYPDGYRGHLTEAGLAARAEVLARRASTKAAVRALATRKV